MVTGQYLAQLTKEVFGDLESSKYQLAEYRISIYGRSASEWTSLAAWVVDNSLVSPNVRWMIQIPRLYHVYRSSGQVANFQEMLRAIFEPLFEVTLNPSINPKLHKFLCTVVGFDCVDDESKQELARDAEVPHPSEWDLPFNPPYYYWIYYLSANLRSLNQLRQERGMSTFSFRPHGGEAGDVEHMAACFLTSESINHGITMERNTALQYLFYLDQIGLAMSPLSNNRLFLEYAKNPFYKVRKPLPNGVTRYASTDALVQYFMRGLNVSLSTDDPLLLHYTKEALVEEYCVAAQVFRLTPADLCEIARTSVLQSGFEFPFKAFFIGENFAEPGPRGNDIFLTNVPNIRLQYRLETLRSERALIAAGARAAAERRHPTSMASSSAAAAAAVTTAPAKPVATTVPGARLQSPPSAASKSLARVASPLRGGALPAPMMRSGPAAAAAQVAARTVQASPASHTSPAPVLSGSGQLGVATARATSPSMGGPTVRRAQRRIDGQHFTIYTGSGSGSASSSSRSSSSRAAGSSTSRTPAPMTSLSALSQSALDDSPADRRP